MIYFCQIHLSLNIDISLFTYLYFEFFLLAILCPSLQEFQTQWSLWRPCFVVATFPLCSIIQSRKIYNIRNYGGFALLGTSGKSYTLFSSNILFSWAERDYVYIETYIRTVNDYFCVLYKLIPNKINKCCSSIYTM